MRVLYCILGLVTQYVPHVTNILYENFVDTALLYLVSACQTAVVGIKLTYNPTDLYLVLPPINIYYLADRSAFVLSTHSHNLLLIRLRARIDLGTTQKSFSRSLIGKSRWPFSRSLTLPILLVCIEPTDRNSLLTDVYCVIHVLHFIYRPNNRLFDVFLF